MILYMYTFNFPPAGETQAMMKVSIAVAVLLVAVVGCNGAVSAPDSPEDMGAVRRYERVLYSLVAWPGNEAIQYCSRD